MTTTTNYEITTDIESSQALTVSAMEVGTPTASEHAVNIAYLTGLGSGLKNKLDATTAPTTGDDTGDGYSEGSIWVDVTNDKLYVCVDKTAAAAVWLEVISTTGTHTLTNKSIDVDNNTLSNIEVDNLKAGVLDTDLSSVSASDDTIPSAKATKAYVDSQVASKDAAAEISYSNATSGLSATDVQAAIDEVEGRVDTAESDISTLQGSSHTQNTDTGTSGNDFAIGDGADSTKSITFQNADANKPKIRFNHSTNKIEYTEDGTNYIDLNEMTSQGDVIIGDASGRPTRLALGASGYALISNGTTAAWQSITTSPVAVTSKAFGDSPYTALTTDETIKYDTSGGASTVNLYTAVGNSGRSITIIKTTDDNNVLTVDGNSTETINSELTISLTYQYEKVTLISDGSNWLKVNTITHSSPKNLLVNGNFDHWQRGTSFVYTDTYGADMWGQHNSTQGVWSRQTFSASGDHPSDSRYVLRVAGNASNSMRLGVASPLTLEETIRLRGKIVTFTGYIKFSNTAFSIASNYNIYLGYTTASSDGSFSGTDYLAGGNATKLYTSGSLPTTWQKFSITLEIPTNATNVVMDFRAAGSNTYLTTDYVEISRCMLVDSVIVPNNYIYAGATIEGDLNLCKSYYQSILSFIKTFYASSTSVHYNSIFLEKEMWKTPSISWTDGTLSNVTSTAIANINSQQFSLNVTPTGAGRTIVGSSYDASYTASAVL